MYAVIFRATVGELDQEYAEVIERMKALAFEEYDCLEFFALMEGEKRIAISYWESEEDILKWKKNIEHLAAQRRGAEKWYASYTVQVAEIQREYGNKL